jgi:hypothetical protein
LHFVHLGAFATGGAGLVITPWEGNGTVPAAEGGWDDVVAPTAVQFADGYPERGDWPKQYERAAPR